MATIGVEGIPTLSDNYKQGKLQPLKDGTTIAPSGTINSQISMLRTSIISLEVTAIVNAANSSLRGGGGVDGAIHRAAGSELLAACRPLGGCHTGSAKITAGFDLPAQHVIHAVGPVYDSTNKAESASMLKGCYDTSLELVARAAAGEKNGASIAFSCISTGIYGYPSTDAAHVACKAVRNWLERQEASNLTDDGTISRVIFCCFEEKDVNAYIATLPRYFPPTQEELPNIDNTNDGRATGERFSASEGDGEEWEKVEKPTDVAAEPLDYDKVKGTTTGTISQGTQDNPGGIDNNAQNQLMKDW